MTKTLIKEIITAACSIFFGLSLVSLAGFAVHALHPPSKKSQQPPPTAIPSLLSLFNTDFDAETGASTTSEGIIRDKLGNIVRVVKYKVVYSTLAGAKYFVIYIGNYDDSQKLLDYLSKVVPYMISASEKKHISCTEPGMIGAQSLEQLPFSGTVYIYAEYPFSFSQMSEIQQVYRKLNMNVQFRGEEWRETAPERHDRAVRAHSSAPSA